MSKAKPSTPSQMTPWECTNRLSAMLNSAADLCELLDEKIGDCRAVMSEGTNLEASAALIMYRTLASQRMGASLDVQALSLAIDKLNELG